MSSKLEVAVILLIVLITLVQGRFSRTAEFAVKPGNCPKIPPQTAFDSTKFEGSWYPVAQLSGKYQHCQELNITALSQYELEVQLIHHITSGTTLKTGIKWISPDILKPGFFHWSYKAVPLFVEEATVVDTDYENYAALLSCVDLGLFHVKGLVILSRVDDTISTLFLDRIKKVMGQYFDFNFENAPLRTFYSCYHRSDDYVKQTIVIDEVVNSIVNISKKITDN